MDPALAVFVEMTLLKALTGEQLGENVVFDLSRENVSDPSLALIVVGRSHERDEGEAANYGYYLS